MNEEIEKGNNIFKKTPYKEQDFETYVLWKSLPSILRGQPRAMLEKQGYDDELALELLQIKSQKDFAIKYGIKDQGTLTDWNKRIEKEGLLDNINSWARKLTPNVTYSLYKNIVKNGKAQEVRAWFELVENRL